ncbi:MAG: preprotein translocase subunit SecE [Candidatus Taylorbacteria bacterium CG10_big_fil_rev_8_21_14_0_10_41_48]|uniref:Protein translocase subunit SecE n=1 Tax=Candidatus Taylorbacteria bacterium CG10_big_fil_rev_8_21_14_0_10_41_48 TaxID=1975024 RepID=A0A2M8LD96_9BACT|nr:MAG: preprotein translocase subunit SecE [Candidatus Taylorbacteria bacterium CG10_big_fil_rev_8_21_14_0_10_41_48]
MSLFTYIKDTRAEMKHVTWPTRSQGINYTLLVIGLSVVTAIVLGVFDFLFSSGIQKIILK